MQSEFSFPSGHTTAAMAGAFAICLCLCLFNSKENNKKYRWVLIPAILYVIVVGASRNYLMVHYPTDIVGGIIAGGIGATLAFLLIHFLYKGLEGNRDSKFCAFMLDADVKNIFKKRT
jgi:undecaprenyl-diphosphatase